MRRLLAGLLLATLLAGCTANDPPNAGPDGVSTVPSDGPENATAPASADGVPPPVHPVGRAWTYEGAELYNEDARFTVVVARADDAGYLFAGGAEDDLVYEALWGSPWFGERARDMDRHEWMNVLDFPLRDGASWDYRDGLRVTARATEVATPVGTQPGFRIEGESERSRVSYDYAPALGQIVRWETGPADATLPRFESLRMVAVAEGEAWVWYELGDLVVVPAPQQPQAFEVPEGHDAVLASAGGRDGSRAILQPPDGEAWTAEFPGEEDWKHAMLDAAPGRWTAAVAGWPYIEGTADVPAEIGWAYMHVAPVTWLRAAE